MSRFSARQGLSVLLLLMGIGWEASFPCSLSAQTENAATRDYAVALGFEKKGHLPAGHRALETVSTAVSQGRTPSLGPLSFGPLPLSE